MQIAQANIPNRPIAGEAIGFPVENLVSQGVRLVITVYRGIIEHRPRRPDFDMGWDPLVLATGATALAIAAHATMYVGESLLEVWVPKERLMTGLLEDRLACPKELYCINDDCLGQDKGSNFAAFHSPYCKNLSLERSPEKFESDANKF